jgi:hypothetical protein
MSGKTNVLRLLAVAAIGFALVLIVIGLASTYWERKESRFQNMPALMSALQRFCSDQARRGTLPPEVSLQDLIKGGYLTSNDVRAFDGMTVTFSTHAADADPDTILARAIQPNGQVVCLMVDGSVQQFSPQRYKILLQSSGLTNGPTNL